MFERTKEDLEAAVTTIGAALLGLEQVSFKLHLVIEKDPRGKTAFSTVVSLWFGHEFSTKVHGSEDIEDLAKRCRETALERLMKIRVIAKANELTK